MQRNGGALREVAVPISLFTTLRKELESEAGTLPTVHALHKAGYDAGLKASTPFHKETGGDAMSHSEVGFWHRLSGFFAKRGWGNLTHRVAHDGIGILSSPDWAEAIPGEDDPEASCCFSTGFLSGMLSQLAGGPVAVLEVSCRTRGGETCDFAFGSEGAIHELYGHLLEGSDLEGALEAL